MRRISAKTYCSRSRLDGEWSSPFAALSAENWRGHSGRSFTHIVFPLVGCPAIKSGSYILVHRDADGLRQVLAIERTRSTVPSLNLARIRHYGATLGANEVHLLELGGTDRTRAAIERDLTQAVIQS